MNYLLNYVFRERASIRKSSGFTLIEVLVSMIIIAIGILGTVALQARSLMDNQDAYLRTQAIYLAYDMSDRIRANVTGWSDVPFPNANDCTAQFGLCSSRQMAEYDIWRWQSNVTNTLPNATSNITLYGEMCSSGVYARGFSIEVRWTRANKTLNEKIGDACYSMDVAI
ncbi:hypothetical protein JCM14076_21060 [Methylosoma difficile]